jgi:hypothetical protein
MEIDPRGPRLSAVITTIVLAVVLIFNRSDGIEMSIHVLWTGSELVTSANPAIRISPLCPRRKSGRNTVGYSFVPMRRLVVASHRRAIATRAHVQGNTVTRDGSSPEARHSARRVMEGGRELGPSAG